MTTSLPTTRLPVCTLSMLLLLLLSVAWWLPDAAPHALIRASSLLMLLLLLLGVLLPCGSGKRRRLSPTLVRRPVRV